MNHLPLILLAFCFCVAGSNLNVFLVPHSHDDPGWQKTIKEYYDDQVVHIINNVIDSLIADPSKRFIYVEQAYFTRWWNDPNTTAQKREQLRYLLEKKQFEFIIGGWVMHDESCTTYSAQIDQMTEGHQFILSTFGGDYSPEFGWQIDPSGLGVVTPSLEKMMGFKGHIIDRIIWYEKAEMSKEKKLNFMWTGSSSLGENSTIFTHLLDHLYAHPMIDGFDWENSKTPLVTPDNVQAFSQKLVDWIKNVSAFYPSPNILIPWGTDFHFVQAAREFSNMDQIVAHIRENADTFGVDIKYSLLSEWYEAVLHDNIQYPTRGQEDFLPYAFAPVSWRTGIPTSRQAIKLLTRKSEAILRACDALYSIGNLDDTIERKGAFEKLEVARKATSVAQHHDAITGTEKNKVALMYNGMMEAGNAECVELQASVLSHIAEKNGKNPSLTNQTTSLLNIKQGEPVAVLVYNSLGWTRHDIAQVPLNRRDVVVRDSSGNLILFQINPNPFGSKTEGEYSLFFQIDVPPLGYRTYFVEVTGKVNKDVLGRPTFDPVLSNPTYQLTFSSTTGRLVSIRNKKDDITTMLDQNALAYTSYTGKGQKSSAYVFRPVGPAQPFSNDPVKTIFYYGPLVNESYMVFPAEENKPSYFEQIIRLYNGFGHEEIDDFIQIQHKIGVIPGNREIITRFSSNISNGGTFFTDDNGMETIKRTYNASLPDLPIPANYYPSIYWMWIQDKAARLTLLASSTHSISSQKPGELEILLHRRILTPTEEINEPLNDTHIIYPEIRLLLNQKNAEALKYKHSYLMNYPLTFFFSTVSGGWPYNTNYSPLSKDLPQNIHLLSLKVQNASSTIILRLHHLFAIGEDSQFSLPVDVDLEEIFSLFEIASFEETTLSANKLMENSPSPARIHLTAKNIRTFLLQLKPKKYV